MKLRQNVNLGAAFDRLKDALREADKYRDDPKNEFGYAGAYGILATHVHAFIYLNTEGQTFDEIRKLETDKDPDDLKQVLNRMPDIDEEIERELLT